MVSMGGLPERRTKGQAGRMTRKTPGNIRWVSEPAESIDFDDVARMLMFFRGCADVERAITRDITRGGLAAKTRALKVLHKAPASMEALSETEQRQLRDLLRKLG